MSLWGDTLERLGAIKTLREVVQLVDLALCHSPLLIASPDKHRLEAWLEATQMGLPRYPTCTWEFDAEAQLKAGKYLWLVKNRLSGVSPILLVSEIPHEIFITQCVICNMQYLKMLITEMQCKL